MRASPLLYNFWVNQVYKGEASAQKTCRPISSSRQTLPGKPVGFSRSHSKRLPSRGLCFLPMHECRGIHKGFFMIEEEIFTLWLLMIVCIFVFGVAFIMLCKHELHKLQQAPPVTSVREEQPARSAAPQYMPRSPQAQKVFQQLQRRKETRGLTPLPPSSLPTTDAISELGSEFNESWLR